MIHLAQMIWNCIGFCRVGPADSVAEQQMPEPCRVTKCWRSSDSSLWAEELTVPPGKPGLIMSLQMWISEYGYVSAVLQFEGRTVLLSRHPLLKYTVIEPPPVQQRPGLHAPDGKVHKKKRCV